jgi:hypothetical protein
MLKLPFELAMVTMPLAGPTEFGLNVTWNEVLSPAFSVGGRDRTLGPKPLPLTEAAEMVISLLLVLLNFYV